MEVKAFVVSPVQSNCYVVSESLEPGAKAVVIDPGDRNLDSVFDYIDSHRLNVIANWNTHAHFDHVAGVDILREKYQVPSFVHQDDLPLWESLSSTVQKWTGEIVPPLRKPDGFFQDGQVLHLGDNTFTVWLTPGHSPGSVCLIGDEIAFTGDTLFAGSIGRTDLPLSNPKDMQMSLKKLLDWPDHLRLYPGHMQGTTMQRERLTNPFLQSF